jgi:flagellin-like hook-associated protein FlgL
MDDEYQALVSEIERIATNTQWNKMNILTGSGGEVGLGSAFTFQIGANAGQVISVGISNQGIVSTAAGAPTQYSASKVLPASQQVNWHLQRWQNSMTL